VTPDWGSSLLWATACRDRTASAVVVVYVVAVLARLWAMVAAWLAGVDDDFRVMEFCEVVVVFLSAVFMLTMVVLIVAEALSTPQP